MRSKLVHSDSVGKIARSVRVDTPKIQEKFVDIEKKNNAITTKNLHASKFPRGVQQ